MINLKKSMFCVLMIAAILLTGCSTAANSAVDSSSTANPDSSSSADNSTTGGTIRFAVMGPMTGDNSQPGIQQEYGVRLAVQEINAAGGINGKKLEYDVYDDQANTNQAVICAEKIADKGNYDFVVTSTHSGPTIAAYPTWLEADLAVISGINTSDRITGLGFTNYVRTCHSDGASLKELMAMAMDKYGFKHPVCLHAAADTDIFNAGLANDFLKENYGLEFEKNVQIQAETEKDYTAHITNFKNSGADALFFFGDYSPAALYLKQAYSLGYKIPTFSLSGCSNPQLIEVAGADAAEGFFTMTSFESSNPDPRVQKFVSDYEALAGFTPAEWAAGAYDVIYVMAQALGNDDAKDLRGKALIDWMRANSKYTGIMATVDGFDENGDNPNTKSVILQVQNGKFEIFKP